MIDVESSDPLAKPPKSLLAVTFLILVILTAVMTYPQVVHLRDGVNDIGDPLLNAWALSWVEHQLPIAPARVFNGNIFYPERNALAFSETLLAPAIVFAPLRWLGAGTILVYNIVFLSGFVISGVGTSLLVYALTADSGAAIVAGIVFAFLPFRIEHYAHLQLQQTQFIPFSLWALHRLVQSGRVGDGALFGVCVAGQLLSCLYYGIFMIPYLAVVAVAMLLKGRVSKTRVSHLVDVHLQFDLRGCRRRIIALTVGAVVCLVIVAPTGRAYVAARELVGERAAAEVAGGGATWLNFLATSEANALYGRWADTFGSPERRLFAGLLPLALSLVALWPPFSRVRLAYGLGLLFALDMSRGFNGLTYSLLYDHLLPFRALRIPARMGILVGFSFAVLTGFGVARLNRLVRSKSSRALVAAGCALLVLFEYRSKPIGLAIIPLEPPAIYQDLLRFNSDVPQPILELPIAREDPTYMYYSTFHWRPLVNGYSGFFPRSFSRLVDSLRMFPTERGFAALRGHGTGYILVHGELMRANEYATMIAALDARKEVTLLSRRPWQRSEISLYQLNY